jgi:hypothetical protein
MSHWRDRQAPFGAQLALHTNPAFTFLSLDPSFSKVSQVSGNVIFLHPVVEEFGKCGKIERAFFSVMTPKYFFAGHSSLLLKLKTP